MTQVFEEFLISLPDDKNRRENFYRQVYGNNFIYIPAISGKYEPNRLLPFDESRARDSYGRSLTAGEKACTLSHLLAFEDFVERGQAEYAIICEDDALLSADYGLIYDILSDESFRSSLFVIGESKAPSFEGSGRYRLAYPMEAEAKTYECGGKTYKVGRLWQEFTCGTVAYVISRSAARAILECFHREGAYWLADDFALLERVVRGGADCDSLYVKHLYPRLVIEDGRYASNLEGERKALQAANKGQGEAVATKSSLQKLQLLLSSLVFYSAKRRAAHRVGQYCDSLLDTEKSYGGDCISGDNARLDHASLSNASLSNTRPANARLSNARPANAMPVNAMPADASETAASTGPMFSIVIPAYNGAKTIERAVKSCLQQSYNDLEIIVVDDGSTDETAAVVRAMEDPRIRLITMEQNKGTFAARARGIEAAKGEYVLFLDCDDKLKPDCCAMLKRGRGWDLGFFQYEREENGHCFPPMAWPLYTSDDLLGDLRRGDLEFDWSIAGKVYRREVLLRGLAALGELPDHLINAEDYLLYVACCPFVKELWALREPLYVYTGSEGLRPYQTAESYEPIGQVLDAFIERQESAGQGEDIVDFLHYARRFLKLEQWVAAHRPGHKGLSYVLAYCRIHGLTYVGRRFCHKLCNKVKKHWRG